MLDVGCGTGSSSLVFADRGFDVTGCDISPDMLDVARRRDTAHRITYMQTDMRDLPPELTGFDVISWMDDVANHLLTAGDLRSAITASARALNPEDC